MVVAMGQAVVMDVFFFVIMVVVAVIVGSWLRSKRWLRRFCGCRIKHKGRLSVHCTAQRECAHVY